MSKNDFKDKPKKRLKPLRYPLLSNSYDRNALSLRELEDRVLLSANPMAVVQQVAPIENLIVESAQNTQAEQNPQTGNSLQSDSYEQQLQSSEFDFGGIDAPALIQELKTQTETFELVFIDDTVTDSDQLIDDLAAANGPRRFEVIRIDASSDGIEQITTALGNFENVDAIHIVSHGEHGSVRLGSTWLSLATLDQHASSLGTWSAALSQEADILFYGCDLAQTDSGQTLLEAISLLTQADVAASTDDTGTALLGGDWDLEFHVGSVDTGVAFSASVQSEWKGLLATQTDTVFFADSSAGTINRLNLDGSVTTLYSGLGTNGPADLVIDSLHGKLYWTNKSAGTISSANLDGTVGVELVVSGENNIVGLAIDPYQSRLYWTRNGGNQLRASDLDGGNKSNLLTGLDNPIVLKIDLIHGTLYWVENGSTKRIASGEIHGSTISNVTTLVSSGLSDPSGIALDVTNNRLYWTDKTLGTVSGINLDGSNRQTLVTGLTTADDIEIDTKNQRLYWSSNNGSTVQSSSVYGSNLRTETSGASGAEGIAFSSATTQLINTNERQVPTYNTNNMQETSRESRGSGQAIAMDAQGNYIVVWSSGNSSGSGTLDGSGWGVFAQRYDRFGQTIGINFQVNGYAINDQRWASVAMYAEGYFAIAWTSQGQDGSQEGVYTKIYRPDGTAITGDVRMNSTTTFGRQFNPAIEISNTGEIFVAWQGEGPSDSYGIFGRRIDIDGNSIDANEFLINTRTANNQYDVSVDYNADGSFIAAWDDRDGIHFRRFNSDGSPIDATQVNVDGAITAGNNDVAYQPNGDFIVTWRDTDGDYTLYARRYNANGTPKDVKFIVSQTHSGNQFDSSIAVAADGKFIIAWEGNGRGDSSGVFARKFNADGVALSDEFVLSQNTNGNQSKVSIALTDIDNFVATWTHEVSATDTDVFARQFGTSPAPAASLFFSTKGAGTGATGLSSWLSSDVLQFGDPNFQLGDGATSGEVSKFIGLPFSNDGNGTDIDAYHYVTRDITLGTNSTVSLKAGDILFSFADDETFTLKGVTITMKKSDIMRYSPMNEGGLDQGTLSILFGGLESLSDPDFNGINNIRGFTLVETRTQIGDVIVEAGDFLYSRNGGAEDNDIYVFHTLEAGQTTSDGTTEVLLEGSDIGISDKIMGVHLVSHDLMIGGKLLTEGTLLLTLDGDGDTVGSTMPVTVNRHDIFALNLSQTTLGNGTAIGTAEIILDGRMIGLDTNDESISALSLVNYNQLPTANDDAFTVNEDSLFTSATGALLANDNNPNGDEITAVLNAGPANASAFQLFADGTFNYTPTANFVGTDTFTYYATDGTNNSNIVTVTVSVNPVNDAPVIVQNRLSINEGQTVTLTASDLEITDAEQSDKDLVITVNSVSNGMFVDVDSPTTAITTFTMRDIRDGQIRFVHNGGENAPAFLVSVTDGESASTAVAATINFTNMNDFPTITTIADQAIIENGTSGPLAFTLSDSETPSGELTVTAKSSDQALIPNANIVVTGSGANRTVTVTPQVGLSGGPVTITLQVSDGTSITETHFHVTVTSIDTPPVITTTTLSIAENQLSGTFVGLVNAFDLTAGEVFSWSIVGGTGQSKFSIDPATGRVTTTARLDFEAQATYTLQVMVTDSTLLTDTRSIIISVLDRNDSPEAQVDSYTISQGTTLNVPSHGLLLNDTDQDGNTLKAQLVSSTTFGTLILNMDGGFSYVTASAYHATDSFSYRVFDGTTTSNTVTVTIGITGASAPPPNNSGPENTNNINQIVPDGPESENGTTTPVTGISGGGTIINPTSLPTLDGVVGNTPVEQDDDREVNEAFAQQFIDPFAILTGVKVKNQPLEPTKTDEVVERETRSSLEQNNIERELRSTNGLSFDSQQVLGTFRYTVLSVQQLQETLTSQAYQTDLDKLEQTLESNLTRSDFIKGSVAAGASSSFAIGYVLWTLRGGILLTSLLAQMPAWRLMDPLVVLEYLDFEGDGEEDDSLQSLVENANEKNKDSDPLFATIGEGHTHV